MREVWRVRSGEIPCCQLGQTGTVPSRHARDDIALRAAALGLFDAAWSGKAVRLIGFGVANFQSSPDDGQSTLFADPKDESRRKRERLSAVLDDLRSRGVLGA